MVDNYLNACATSTPITNLVGENVDFMISVGNGKNHESGGRGRRLYDLRRQR